jgi:hypothetical protein
MNSALPGHARPPRRRLDPKYAPLLVPAIMATAMSLVMSLVQTIARLGFSPNLASAWLTSFAIGVAVAIPTAILVAPRAQRLVGHLTGAPRRPPRPIAEPPVKSLGPSSDGMPLAADVQTPTGGQRHDRNFA